VSIRFVNKGVTDIKFLYVKVKESSDIKVLSTPGSYLGNIDSDDYETADFEINVVEGKEGIAILPLEIEYKDAINRDYVVEKNLEIRIYSEEDLEKLGEKEGNPVIGTIIVIVIVAGLLVIYFYMRKRKKR